MKQEQKMQNDSCCMDCGTNNCCHNDIHGNSNQLLLLRWLLGVLIIVVTFAIGFKLGELKEGAWGYGGLMGGPHIRMMRSMDNIQYAPIGGEVRYNSETVPAQ